MISLPTDVLDLLDAGKTKVAGGLRFDFGTGIYGFIKSQESFDFGGITYVPGGIISISDLNMGLSGTANPFEITLASSPDDGLTPEVLRTIENEDYRDRPVTIYDFHFHPDTGVFLHAQVMRRGYVDVILHSSDNRNGYVITAKCETRALDYTRTNGRKRSNADQQRRAPGDKFFEHASLRGRVEIFWGRKRGHGDGNG